MSSKSESVIGLVTPTTALLENVLEAVRMAGQVEAPVVLSGQVGGCVECKHTVASHFRAEADGTVTWLGCRNGAPETVYILVAAKGLTKTEEPAIDLAKPASNGTGGTETLGGERPRAFRRARYFTQLHHKAKPSKVRVKGKPLTPVRLKVLEAIHEASKEGTVYQELLKKTKLPHGSVQQTAHWLRENALVEARPDAGGTE